MCQWRFRRGKGGGNLSQVYIRIFFRHFWVPCGVTRSIDFFFFIFRTYYTLDENKKKNKKNVYRVRGSRNNVTVLTFYILLENCIYYDRGVFPLSEKNSTFVKKKVCYA